MKKIILTFFVLFNLIFILSACKQEAEDMKPEFSDDMASQFVIAGAYTYDPFEGIYAYDVEDGDITSLIYLVSNNVNVFLVGQYEVVYAVMDSAGQRVTATRVVHVVAPDPDDYYPAQYPQGVDLSNLGGEDKDILVAALEKYLLDNVYGGVPLYTNTNMSMYDPRVELYIENYNGVLGFGDEFSQLTLDDSNVLMSEGVYGEVGAYTWRDAYKYRPSSFNPWFSGDSTTSEFTDLFSGGLYNIYFDETKSGYEILPELAASLPEAIDPTNVEGETFAKKWTIGLKDDLIWKFHPDTDVSNLGSDYDILDAHDYMWTFKYALDHDWFRSQAGGFDFVSKGIKNVTQYLEGSVSWDEVGLKLIDDYTIEIEYDNETSAFEVLYGFTGGILSPINQQLFERLGDPDEGGTYGLSPIEVASSGVYYLDEYQEDDVISFKKNELHPQSDLYQFTGIQYSYLEDLDSIFDAFIEGLLDSTIVPSNMKSTYANDRRVVLAPDLSVYKLNMNAFGTVEKRDEYIQMYPDSIISNSYEPEPILMYLEMRNALMFGLDRELLTISSGNIYMPAYTLIPQTYFLDRQSGYSVRTGIAGQAVLKEFKTENYEPLIEEAFDYFLEAVSKGISDGYYEAGTYDNYTEIELLLAYTSSGNRNMQTLVENLVEQYETLFVDDTNFVKIVFDVIDVAFPSSYYDYSLIAQTDLSIGAISGAILDMPNFLNVFCDDNRSEFTLNWGIDTTSALIEVAYHNMDGDMVYEKWSYNALVEALIGRTYVRDGKEQFDWDHADSLIEAYLYMDDRVSVSIDEANDLLEHVLSDTVEQIKSDENFDDLNGYIAIDENEDAIFYVLSVKDGLYKLYDRVRLYADVNEAILGYVNENYGIFELLEVLGPLTDEQIDLNAYLNQNYSQLNSIEDIADELDATLEYVEVYSTTWRYNNSEWADVIVMLHIEDYYIGIEWF